MGQLKDKLNNILVDKREEDDIYAGSILSKYQG